ncbi:MAG: hypothetical protein HYZ23_01580 [Chloroflexi bacterium]|nr:hypothetical protein [Chloroflexota bacterium]
MKTKTILWIAFLFILFSAMLAIVVLGQPSVSGQNLGAASLALQATPAPADEDLSEIGSTDGIFIMGVVIVLIVVVPILLPRKKH